MTWSASSQAGYKLFVWLFVLVWKPVEDISCVSWNKQVQHILASANPSGKASVWDLRKNDLIIKVSDHSNRVRYFSWIHLDVILRHFPTTLWSNLILRCLVLCAHSCFRCIALGLLGTQKWRLSSSWLRRMTECRSFRCGTCALLPLLLRFLRITHGKHNCSVFAKAA